MPGMLNLFARPRLNSLPRIQGTTSYHRQVRQAWAVLCLFWRWYWCLV